MAYTCPRCSGSGQSLIPGTAATEQCPRCFGTGTLIEDSQGLSVAWGAVALGKLTGVKMSAPTCSVEDVTGLNAPLVSYGSHTGIFRQLIAGDISPGLCDLQWSGTNGLTFGMIGQNQMLTITHPVYGLGLLQQAILITYDVAFSTNELVQGTAKFQLLGT